MSLKKLKFITCAPGFMGAVDQDTARYKSKDSNVDGQPLGQGAYIHGEAQKIAGYDKPIFFDGDLNQLDSYCQK